MRWSARQRHKFGTLETDSEGKKLRHLHCVSNGFSSLSHQFSVLDLKSLSLRSHASWTCSGTTGHSWMPYPTLPLRAAMSLRVRHYPQLCSDTNNLSGVIYANLWLWVRRRQTLRCRLAAVKHLKNGIPIQGFGHHGMVLGQIGGHFPKISAFATPATLKFVAHHLPWKRSLKWPVGGLAMVMACHGFRPGSESATDGSPLRLHSGCNRRPWAAECWGLGQLVWLGEKTRDGAPKQASTKKTNKY